MAPQRKVMAHATREANRAARRTTGTLKGIIVTETTQRRYVWHALAFCRWVDVWLGVRASDLWVLGDQLAEYVAALWEEGEAKAVAHYTMAAVQHFTPQVKGSLHCAWRLVSAWDKRELPCRAPPLLLEVLLGMAGLAVLQGYVDVALTVCWITAFSTRARD